MIKKISLLVLFLSCYTTLQAQFITTWETTTANESITIPTTGTGYNYTVDWGDSTTSTNQTTNATHPYTVAGTYTISITGDFPRIYFNNEGDMLKIKSIEQWGNQVWTSMGSAFQGCANLLGNATDVPNLSMVADMSSMFSGASSFNQNIGNWIVSNVSNMVALFSGASIFNQHIGSWDVSNVATMNNMFRNAEAFNGNIGDWGNKTLRVTDMSLMFGGARSFNQDLLSWDVSSVGNMFGMFHEAIRFNGNIESWNVSRVTNMELMFNGAIRFNGNLKDWTVSSVENMYRMFHLALSFNGDIGDWIVLKVTDMEGMFDGASIFNQDIGRWDVTNVTNMSSMFLDASTFDHNLGGWNVINVGNMNGMFNGITLSMENYEALLKGWSKLNLKRSVFFSGGSSVYCKEKAARQKLIDNFDWYISDGGEDCSLFDAQFITIWKTTMANESITIPTTGPSTGYNYIVDWGDGTPLSTNYTENATHAYVASGTYTVTITGDFPRIYFDNKGDKLKIQSIEQWSTQKWTSMENAFYGCENLQGNAKDIPDLSNNGRAMNMSGMFQGASSFNQNIGDWNVSNVTTMENMFRGASSFNQNIGDWNVSSVTSMKNMFRGASSFNGNLLNWSSSVRNVENMEGMFDGAINFNQSMKDWNVGSVKTMKHMFRGTLRFNGNLDNWNNRVSNVVDMEGMFDGAESFNRDLRSWAVRRVTTMKHMFRGASSFNGNLGNWYLSVRNVENMEGMFDGATSFSQDIGNWSISNVATMSNMFRSVTLSKEHYEALLKGWSSRVLQNGVFFDGGNSVYCNAEVARQKMIDDFGWTITDGGKDCSLSTPDITAETFKVYPTPTSGNIQIDLDAAIQQITIYNLLGVEVMSQKQVNKKRVDLSALSAGTYILKIQTDTHTIVRKVVKK